MSAQELTALIELANLSTGRAREIAEGLFRNAIVKSDPIDVLNIAYETFPNIDGVSAGIYKAIFEKVRPPEMPEARLKASLKFLAEFGSVQELMSCLLKGMKDPDTAELFGSLKERFKAPMESSEALESLVADLAKTF